jgi:predicted dehydrogenase
VKTRRAAVVGDRKMVIFEDTHTSEKLRVYDKGVSYQPVGSEYAEFVAAVRDGDIVIPYLEPKEPLKEQLAHFVQCVATGARPISDGESGLAVVRVLEAAEAELTAAAHEVGASPR